MCRKRVPIPPSVRMMVFIRDGFRCVYCGATANEARLEVDHVISWADGGTNDPGNLVTACRTCNIGKGAKEVIPATEDDVGLYVSANRVGGGEYGVHAIAEGDPRRFSPASAWYGYLKQYWPTVDQSPASVSVQTGNDHVGDSLFHPTFTCTGRSGCDFLDYPCTIRVLVVPWRDASDFTDGEKHNIKTAVISGYEVPTMIIMGTPRLFYAVVVNERYKGNPIGVVVDQFMQPFEEWANRSWYPDEDFDFQDLRLGVNRKQLIPRTWDYRVENVIGVYCSFEGETI